MKLHKIKLENIRSYIAEEVVFPDGKVLLWGNIGSGKSSILYAIDFVLFGLQRAELAGASLLRNGSEEGSVELFLSIDGKEYVLKRVLKRTKNSVVQDAGHIIRNGVKEEKTAIELKQIVLELLNYPRDLITKNKTLIYRYTVYTPQEEMKTILLGPKEERLDTLRKVFGVDKYKRVRENAKILISEMKDRKKIYEGATSDLAEKILEKEKREQHKKEISLRYSALFPLFQEAEMQLIQKKEQLILLEKKKEELNHIQKELALCTLHITHTLSKKESLFLQEKELLKEIEILEGEKLEVEDDTKSLIHSLEEQMLAKQGELKDIEEKKGELSRLQKELALCQLHITHTLSEKENIFLKEQELLKEIEALQEQKLEIQENVKELIQEKETLHITKEKELREILNKIQEFKTRKAHAQHIQQKIESLNTCPTCFQEVSSEYKHKVVEHSSLESDRFDKEIQKFQLQQVHSEQEIQDIRTQLDIFKKREQEALLIQVKLKHLEKKKEELSFLQKKNTELEMKVLSLRIQKEELEKKQEPFVSLDLFSQEAQTKLDSFREQRELLRKREQDIALIELKKQNLDKKKEELLLAQKKILDLETSLSPLEIRQKELVRQEKELLSLYELYVPLQKDMEFTQKKFQDLQLEKTQIDVAQKHTQLLIEHLEQDIHKKTLLREKKEYLNKIQFWLSDFFSPLMETMEKNILFKVHAEFNALFEKWFSILIDNQTLSMSLDEEYSPKILQNGYELEYEYLSGGEKTAGALAYRLALNQVINNLHVGLKTEDLLILDEPTDGFSSEQLDRLKILMDEIDIPQIIMVSHEAQIECFADHIIRFEKREHCTKVIS